VSLLCTRSKWITWIYSEKWKQRMISSRRAFVVGHTRTRAILSLLTAGILLGGCGGGHHPIIYSDNIGRSGVRGTAFVVAADGITRTPLPNAVIIVQQPSVSLTGAGRPLTFGPILFQTQADALGNYSIALTPGRYGIGGQDMQMNRYRGVTNSVGVVAGQYLQTDVVFTKPVTIGRAGHSRYRSHQLSHSAS